MKFFLDKLVTIKRLRYIDINRSVYSATGTAEGYKCSWQEPNPEKVQMYDGQIGNLFSVFVDISMPAVEGDHVIRDGVSYGVRDVKTVDFGSFQHKRLIVTKGD